MFETLPLTGIKVVELGSSISGPSCTEALAFMGADVIKVEGPEGDATRAWGTKLDWNSAVGYECVNREKRSVTVDFGNAEQLEMRAIAIGIHITVDQLWIFLKYGLCINAKLFHNACAKVL